MDIGSEIRVLRIRAGLTQKELAKEVGLSAQSIMRYENGERVPTLETLSKLEEYFDVHFGYHHDSDRHISSVLIAPMVGKGSTMWGKGKAALKHKKDIIKGWIDGLDKEGFNRLTQLLSVAGMFNFNNISNSNSEFASVSSLNDEAQPKLLIPVMGRSAAGLPMEMIEVPETPIAINGEACIQAGDFAVIAVGDSMVEAGIHDGDKCVIRPQEWVENGQIALVAVEDGSTIKKFFKDDDGFRLVPCNHAHPIQHYSCDAPIRVLGRFISVVG